MSVSLRLSRGGSKKAALFSELLQQISERHVMVGILKD